MKKILLIEDDEFLCFIMCKVLLAKGYKVIATENSLLGLQFATEIEPDLIISDMNMLDLKGDEILKQVRANPETANIPFICMTAEQDSKKRHYALQLGANDYLTKPFKFPQLLTAVARQIENKRPCCINNDEFL